MAITKCEYKHLWEDIKIRKGKDYDDLIAGWIKTIDASQKATPELKWLIYRFEQQIRTKTYLYIEVIEKSLISILQEEEKAINEYEKLANKWNKKNQTGWTLSKLFCSVNINCIYKKTKTKCNNEKSIHSIFNNIINEEKINAKISKMHIYNKNTISEIESEREIISDGIRNPNNHYKFILSKWMERDENDSSTDLEKFLNIFNLHYKHSYALKILAELLSIFTSEYTLFAKKILENNEWLFKENAAEATSIPGYDYLTKDYIEIVKYQKKFKFKNFYKKAFKLLSSTKKTKRQYVLRRKHADKIEKYLRKYINHTTIAIRKSQIEEKSKKEKSK